MDERRLEIKVGLFLLAALASAILLFWWLGAFELGGDSRLEVDFSHSGGVPVGAPVKLAGVSVGRVRSVHLLPARRDAEGQPIPVQIDVRIPGEILAALHQDARVTVSMQGALGEPYLELYPGSESKPLLQNGASLRGADPPRVDELIAELDDLVKGAHRLLGANPREVGQLIAGASDLTSTANTILSDNRQALSDLIHEASAAASDFRSLAKEANGLVTSGRFKSMVDDASAVAAELHTDLPPLARDAHTLTSSAVNLGGGFTPKDGAELRQAITRYEVAASQLDALATRGDVLLGQLEQGQGTLGGLYKDPKVYDDLKALVTDLKQHPWKVLWKE